MRILDCETIGKTYGSLEAILGIDRETLKSLFASIVPSALTHAYPGGCPAEGRGLLSRLRCQTGCPTDFDATRWFHCTRTWEHAFEEGLLPHSLAQEKIWEFLHQMVAHRLTSEQWNSARNAIPRTELYAERLRQGSRDDGPHALLVRESAMVEAKSGWGTDYFTIPELVDNISRPFYQMYNIDLATEFQMRTRAAIVKFQINEQPQEALQVAAYYAYRKFHGLDVGEGVCSLCYSGQGHTVDPRWIEKVEFILRPRG